MADDFPYVDEDHRIDFPLFSECPADAPLAAGGNLSPGMLLSAYEQGAFPWFNPGDPILWWNPDPRFVLFPEDLHVSKRFSRSLKQLPFLFSMDRSFGEVIRACSDMPRPGQDGTWITEEMISGYEKLHRLGWAHSIEVRKKDDEPGAGELIGGLYGVAVGSCFCGESMFTLESGASKAAFILLVRVLERAGFSIIDCQMETPHMKDFGGRNIPRQEYMGHLYAALEKPPLRGSWDGRFELVF